jgi:PAS domain S-box-containing protein
MFLSAPRLSSRWFARPLIVGSVVLLILFAVTALLELQYRHERQAASSMVVHSRQVIDALDRLRASISGFETERRGYLLTRDPAYLKPYTVSDESVKRNVQTIQTLVARDSSQSLHAAHLALSISAQLREMDAIAKTPRTSGPAAALAVFGNMDPIRSEIVQMVDRERSSLVYWLARADTLERRKSWVIASAGLIVSFWAGVALVLARLEAGRRKKATEENIQLQSDLQERESKIRQLFDANIIGIVIFDFEGRFIDANDAFLNMVGYNREDLVSGRMNRTDMTPVEWRAISEQRMADLRSAAPSEAFEKEYFRKDGSRVPVLVGPAGLAGRMEGIAFVLDLTERKRAEDALRESELRYREAMMELAHANRVITMGQLTASIAHEVNQPISAAVTNARAALRWLEAQPPDMTEVRQALDRVVRDGNRAGDVVRRIHALVKKSSPGKESLSINEAILEVLTLTRGELSKSGILVRTDLADGLPRIQGDRIQLQQVILNLIINAIDAMSGVVERARELGVSTTMDASNCVLVAVRDSGPGLGPVNPEQIFNAFYTTKSGGMGMGLSICRSIIEAHGGRVWATANVPQGASFLFTLPWQGMPNARASPAQLSNSDLSSTAQGR